MPAAQPVRFAVSARNACCSGSGSLTWRATYATIELLAKRLRTCAVGSGFCCDTGVSSAFAIGRGLAMVDNVTHHMHKSVDIVNHPAHRPEHEVLDLVHS